MQKSLTKENRLTEGNIWKQIIVFVLPLLASSLIQQLYNTVDLIFVGQFLDKNASIAVGSGSLLIACIINFFTGLSVGAAVITGNAYGAADEDTISKVIHTSVIMSLFAGIVLAIIGVAGAPVFLVWSKIPSEILPLGVTYIRIYFLSIFSIVFFNMNSGILRALGDSRMPMIYQLIGGITNIFANYLFIAVLELGVAGAAYATLASQTVAAVLTVRKLTKLPDGYRLKIKKIKADMQILGRIIKIGFPTGIQSMVLTFSNLVVKSNINMLEVTSIAAFVVYFKVELFVYLPIQAIGQATMTFVSQNFGARIYERARKGIRCCIIIGIITSVLIVVILFNIANPVMALFTRDTEVMNVCYEIIKITFPFYFIYVFLETFSNALRGTGKSFGPMIITIINMCGVRVVLVTIIMMIIHSATGIAMVYPITWFCSAACMAGYYWFSNCLHQRNKENQTCA